MSVTYANCKNQLLMEQYFAHYGVNESISCWWLVPRHLTQRRGLGTRPHLLLVVGTQTPNTEAVWVLGHTYRWQSLHSTVMHAGQLSTASEHGT